MTSKNVTKTHKRFKKDKINIVEFVLLVFLLLDKVLVTYLCLYLERVQVKTP